MGVILIMCENFSEFEKAVYREVLKIPIGQVRTYKQIAEAIGKPKAVRAVGRALKKNPYTILIPCHRVVAENGLGGYSLGIEKKRKLLEKEREIVKILGMNEEENDRCRNE